MNHIWVETLEEFPLAAGIVKKILDETREALKPDD